MELEQIANKKKYFIFYDIEADPTQTDWEKLYNPNQYELILIALPRHVLLPNSNKLLNEADVLKYFSHVIQLETFEYDNLKKNVGDFISHLKSQGVTDQQIEIISDGEFGLLRAAKLREDFKLKGLRVEQATIFRDKIAAKNSLEDLKEYLPKYFKFEPEIYQKNSSGYINLISEQLGFPIFAKSSNLGGGVGSNKINNSNELYHWCENNKNENDLILEQFISGDVYHCECFIKDGKILYAEVGKYLNPPADFYNGKPIGNISLLKNDPKWERIYEFNKMILDRLNPPNGCTHLELFETDSGELLFIECAARTPGRNPIISKITGIDFKIAHYQLQMGIQPKFHGNKGVHVAGLVFPPKEGTLEKQYPPTHLKSKYMIRWNKNPGELLIPPIALVTWVCRMVLINENYEVLKTEFEALSTYEAYSVITKEDKLKFFKQLMLI